MQANDLLKYRDKIINAFKQGTFLSESSKKESKDVQNNFELEDVNKFIPKIESMSKNINPSFFNEFFESSPADYAKYLINLKNLTENKEFVTVAKKQNIKFKRQNKRNERKGKKITMQMKHKRTLKKFLITIDRFKKLLH